MGYQPTQTKTGDWRRTGAKPAGPDEEDTAIVYGDEAVSPSVVVFRGRLFQTGHEIAISDGIALAVLEDVVKRGEKLEPPLDSRNVISHFAYAFERLELRENAKACAPELTSKVVDERLWGTSVKEHHATIACDGVSSTVNRNLRGKRGIVESNDTADETGVMFL